MSWRRFIPYVWTWPFDVVIWLFWILPFWALWGTNLRWEGTSLAFNLKNDSWFYRKFYTKWLGTSIGHGIMYSFKVIDDKGITHPAKVHEHFHTKQFESVMLDTFVTSWIPFILLAMYGHWTAAILTQLSLWLTGTIRHSLANWCTSAIVGDRFYRDSYHEQAAYAVEFKYIMTGKTDT